MVRPASLEEIRAELTARRGRRFLVNHFATWCEPCVEELPLLADLRKRVPDAPFLAISWELFMGWEEPEECLERLRGWAPSAGIDFPVLVYTGPPPDLILGLNVEQGTIPHTVVYAEDGSEALALPRALEAEDVALLESILRGRNGR